MKGGTVSKICGVYRMGNKRLLEMQITGRSVQSGIIFKPETDVPWMLGGSGVEKITEKN